MGPPTHHGLVKLLVILWIDKCTVYASPNNFVQAARFSMHACMVVYDL